MRPSILVGLGLALVILAAGVFAPALRSGEEKRAVEAREQAELARRELERVSLVAPHLLELADVAVLMEDSAALDSAVEQASEQLREISGESSRLVRAARDRAAREGLPEPELQPISADAAGVKRAMTQFRDSIKENDALLKAAISHAQQAASASPDTLGVPQVLGMAQYVHAAVLLSEADQLREEQTARQAELLEAGAKWKLTQAYAGHFDGLEVTPMLEQLLADLEELSALHEEAAARVAELSQAVAEREQTLAQVEEEMRSVREALLQHEQQGFTAGDDASFEAYRDRYVDLSHTLAGLQEQEQALRSGGRPGATLEGPDLATAELEGGETVIGLEELRWRLMTAELRADRAAHANQSLEDHITYIKEAGHEAQSAAESYQQRLANLAGEQRELFEGIAALAQQAYEKEDEALRAATAAYQAFSKAQNGARAWVRAANELQRERDPERKNERLKLLLSDPYVEQLAQSAEAAARVLAARIHASRIEGADNLIADINLFLEMVPEPGFQFDPAPYEEARNTARTEGLAVLETARSIYDALAHDTRAGQTAWVPYGALAAADHLTARLDPAQSSEQLSAARDAIANAVDNRTHNPRLWRFVQFRDHLSGAAPSGSSPESDASSEGDDFFMGGE